MKNARYAMLPILTLFLPDVAFAQILPDGWQQTTNTDTAQEYVFQQNAAKITVVDGQNITVDKLDHVFSNITQGLEKIEPSCRGISSASARMINSRLGRVVEVRNDGDACYALILWSDNRMRLVMAIEDRDANANTIGLSMQLLQRDMGAATAEGGANEGALGATQRTADIATADRQLAQAVAAIPKSNRPIGLIARTHYVSSGTLVSPVRTAWSVFANGYLTDCVEWDPRTTAPTPEALAAFISHNGPGSCDIAKWRRSGNSIIVTDLEDGGEDVDDTTYELADIKPFNSGQRLALDLETTSSFSAQTPGIVGYHSVTDTRWTLSLSGEIGFSERSYVSSRGDSLSRSNADSARYYLDGHIMAIRYPDGNIKIAFAGLSPENGKTYGYLNGEFYWEPD